MAINYIPPKYTDNPDVIRDLVDLIDQLESDILSQSDKDELLNDIQSILSQANAYTDFSINNSGIPILKQIKKYINVEYSTKEILNPVIGSETVVNYDKIEPLGSEFDLEDRVIDSEGTQGIIISIDSDEEKTTVTIETVPHLEIVNYGTEDAEDIFEIANSQPIKSAPEGKASYALTLNDNTSVKIWESTGGTVWNELFVLPITIMALFNISSDDTAKYWFIDRWEDFDINFDIDNYYTKAENDSVINTLNAEIEKREYNLVAGNGIEIDRNAPGNPIINYVGEGVFDKTKLFKKPLLFNFEDNGTPYHIILDMEKEIPGFAFVTEGYAKVTREYAGTKTTEIMSTNIRICNNITIETSETSVDVDIGYIDPRSHEMRIGLYIVDYHIISENKIAINIEMTTIDYDDYDTAEMDAYFYSNFEFIEGYYEEE